MKVELNLTERLFASLIGVRTTLMRPPYAIDEEPDTADQVRPLEIPQEMGYITVGNRIDPNDWSDNPHRRREADLGLRAGASAAVPSRTICAAATSCCCTTAAAIAPKRCAHCR